MNKPQASTAVIIALAALSERLERWYGQEAAALRLDAILNFSTELQPSRMASHPAPYRGHWGNRLNPLSFEKGGGMLSTSAPSAFPVSAATLEKYLGASRMTFLRWGERLGFRPPWTREQAIEIWSAIHRKRLPE